MKLKFKERVNRGRYIAVVGFLILFCCTLTGGCRQSPVDTAPKPSPKENDSMRVNRAIPVTYVALGDSTGAGVGARDGGYVARLFRRMNERRSGSKLTNLCVSGATTREVIRYQLRRAIANKPTLVTLGIGINDIGHGFSPEEFAENLETIVSQLSRETDASLVVTNIPDISTAPRIPMMMRSELGRLITLFNQKIIEVATRHGARVADIFTPTHELLPTHPEYFSGDGFHPSDQGYEVWAEHMWPTVAEAVGIEAAKP